MLYKIKVTWEFAYEPIEKMIGDPPTDGTNWLMIAEDRFMKALPRKFVGELIFKFYGNRVSVYFVQ
jgi:hypothetical protein